MRKTIAALTISTAALLTAYGLDHLTVILRKTMFRSFSSTPLLSIGAFNLAFAALLVLMLLAIKKQTDNSKAAALTCIGIGLLANASMWLYFNLRIFPSGMMEFLSPNSHLSMTGSLIAALGAISLVQSARQNKIVS